jgi:predicted DNA-binding transcriptional regulator YafY
MAPRKSERLMNLVICLLVSRHFVPKAKLRTLVEDYHELSLEAFEKMFERDKEELRELGIPIEIGAVASGFDDEVGYRIRRSEYELPPLTFTAEEVAVLGLAARVWQHASLAEATSRAVLKLGAEGLDADTAHLAALEPGPGAGEPSFVPLWRAVQSHTVVSFDYRRPGSTGPARRTFEPWGIINWRTRWYVVGHDRDRQATRMFRLSRIVGQVKEVSKPRAFEVPDGVDLRAEAERLKSSDSDPRGIASIRVRSGAGNGLRRRAQLVEPDGEGWDLVKVSFGDVVTLAEELAGYATDVVALEPPDVREATIQHLKSLLVESR